VRPQLFRSPIQHGIDELVPIGRAKLLGQLHRFVECYAVRQLGVRLQFVQSKPQNRVLDGIEVRRRDLAQSREAQVERLAMWGNAFDQTAEVFQVDPSRLGILSELRADILPRERIDLELIKSLQRQPARETPCPMA
jgi:hypothetical protein